MSSLLVRLSTVGLTGRSSHYNFDVYVK